MLELNKIKVDYDNKNVIFLALALDKSDRLISFDKTHAFSYNLIPDAKQVYLDYKVTYCPTSMVIDPDGIIIGIPGTTKLTLRAEIDKALHN